MSSAPLNAVVVGLGVGEQHALAFNELPDTTLHAVVEHDAGKAEEFLEKNKLSDVEILSFEEALQDSNVQIISLASFDDHHGEQVLKCMEAGKHVFVEKPLCTKFDELQAIKDLWQKNPVALMSNLVLRKAEIYEWLFQQIEEGSFGEIYAVDGDYLYGRVHKVTQGWRKDVEDYSVMEGGGIHIIDLMLHVMESQPVTVTSSANKIVTKNTDFKHHDFQSAEYSFPNGAIGRITANYGCVHKHQHVLRVFGTKATFIIDDKGPRMHKGRDDNPIEEDLTLETLPRDKGVLIPDFLNLIQNKDFEKAAIREFNLMRVTLAADEALSYKGPLNIKY